MPFYNWVCEKCNATEQTFEHHCTPVAPSHCKQPMVRDWHGEARVHTPASGYPYITRNITPDGSPVEVKSAAHEAELCKIHGVTKRDDQAWIEKEYVGHNWRTGKPEYWEPSGRGMPGSWI